MIKITAKHWTRESVENDPKTLYVFGDNLQEYGNAGQACIRGLPNAIGLPTKKEPTMEPTAFFTDNLEDFCACLDKLEECVEVIQNWEGDVVISCEIGRGLAQMQKHAPKLYGHILYIILLQIAGENDCRA